MSIEFMERRAGILRFSQWRGIRGPGTGLVQIDIELDWHGIPGMNARLRLSRVVGRLAISVGEHRFDFGSIDYGDDGATRSLPEHAWQVNLPFRVELFPVHVDAIERVREGESVTIEVGVRLLLEREETGGAERGRETTTDYEVVRFELSPSDWNRLLEDTGYRHEMLIGIPLDYKTGDRDWGPASEALARAENALRNGLPAQVAAACREVFESLQRRWPSPEGSPNPTWSVEERYRTMVEAGRYLCHPAHHSKGDRGPDACYDMADARVVLAAAATLLAKAARGDKALR